MERAALALEPGAYRAALPSLCWTVPCHSWPTPKSKRGSPSDAKNQQTPKLFFLNRAVAYFLRTPEKGAHVEQLPPPEQHFSVHPREKSSCQSFLQKVSFKEKCTSRMRSSSPSDGCCQSAPETACFFLLWRKDETPGEPGCQCVWSRSQVRWSPRKGQGREGATWAEGPHGGYWKAFQTSHLGRTALLCRLCSTSLIASYLLVRGKLLAAVLFGEHLFPEPNSQ